MPEVCNCLEFGPLASELSNRRDKINASRSDGGGPGCERLGVSVMCPQDLHDMGPSRSLGKGYAAMSARVSHILRHRLWTTVA